MVHVFPPERGRYSIKAKIQRGKEEEEEERAFCNFKLKRAKHDLSIKSNKAEPV